MYNVKFFSKFIGKILFNILMAIFNVRYISSIKVITDVYC